MQQLNQTKWAEHVLNCSDFAQEVALRMDLRDDAARNACFATILISAHQHGLFIEPVPRNTKTPVIPPETAAAAESRVPEKGVGRDKAAAEKADAQIDDVPKVSTPEQEAGARRSALLDGIQSARELLNKEGHVPPITPAGLNAAIAHQFPGKSQLRGLDIDKLESLLMFLSKKLDALREKKTTTTEDNDLDF